MKKEEKKEIYTPTFTKGQIVSSKKYQDYKDFLSGNLEDGQCYTFEQVDALIKKYY